MKIRLRFFLGLICCLGSLSVNADDWKGAPAAGDGGFGGLVGMGLIDSSTGFALIGSASKKILHSGFVPDITNSVSMEGQLGPVFLPRSTAWHYSAHLRWDFEKDVNWTFYALGGVGGNVLSVSSSSRVEVFPRFGVGAFWKMSPLINWRAEVSHELIALGVYIPF